MCKKKHSRKWKSRISPMGTEGNVTILCNMRCIINLEGFKSEHKKLLQSQMKPLMLLYLYIECPTFPRFCKITHIVQQACFGVSKREFPECEMRTLQPLTVLTLSTFWSSWCLRWRERGNIVGRLGAQRLFTSVLPKIINRNKPPTTSFWVINGPGYLSDAVLNVCTKQKCFY